MNRSKIRLTQAILFLLTACSIHATEYHVSANGSDSNTGSEKKPFATITAAAIIAQPGDIITVNGGIYRERVNPPRGGTSDDQRIIYRAAPGETVAIKGSEIVKGWIKAQNDTWKVALPNTFFGDHNPYAIEVRGDWFKPLGGTNRVYHTGSVYLHGHWLTEAASKDAVLEPAGGTPLWFGSVDDTHTTLYAQFKGVDPNEQTVEINVREAVFYPEEPGINYITVRGFILEQAAPNWAPPTAEQVGLIGTHWSKGWIIESNTIRYATCAGVTLGKYGDEWDNLAGSAEGYVGTINRALKNGWSKQNIGHHIVRDNQIAYCEQAGIVGSLGAIFSTISGNTIYEINRRGLFGGAEMAGIKFHGAVDSFIMDNHIYRCGGKAGIWLDWMTQGTRVTRNLLHDNDSYDLFIEVNHGPYLIDNNLILSEKSILDWSQGGAYVHNLIAGKIRGKIEKKRETPFFAPHSIANMQFAEFIYGDERYINNLFVGPANLSDYDEPFVLRAAGNAYLEDGRVELIEDTEGYRLHLSEHSKDAWPQYRPMITSELLGTAAASGARFENIDGTPYRLDSDWFGKMRSENPLPGPFSISGDEAAPLNVWP